MTTCCWIQMTVAYIVYIVCIYYIHLREHNILGYNQACVLTTLVFSKKYAQVSPCRSFICALKAASSWEISKPLCRKSYTSKAKIPLGSRDFGLIICYCYIQPYTPDPKAVGCFQVVEEFRPNREFELLKRSIGWELFVHCRTCIWASVQLF